MFVSAINRGEIKDTEMEAIMDTIVDSLFSVFATLGNLSSVFTITYYHVRKVCNLIFFLCKPGGFQ